jgi:SAM-dependent methyltransferase
MLALLAEAGRLHGDAWPDDWPAPPTGLRLIGIETRPRMVKMARRALGDDATILDADLRKAGLPPGDVVLLFDVIHLMPRPQQDTLLTQIREALPPGGLLVMREADAAGGWGFRAVRVLNWLMRALQGRWDRTFHFRTGEEWRRCLTGAGFDVEMEPMGAGTPFANVVFYARRVAGPPGAAPVA